AGPRLRLLLRAPRARPAHPKPRLLPPRLQRRRRAGPAPRGGDLPAPAPPGSPYALVARGGGHRVERDPRGRPRPVPATRVPLIAAPRGLPARVGIHAPPVPRCEGAARAPRLGCPAPASALVVRGDRVVLPRRVGRIRDRIAAPALAARAAAVGRARAARGTPLAHPERGPRVRVRGARPPLAP